MNVITVSKMRDNLSDTIASVAEEEAVAIQKNNKDVAVLVSSQRYNDLKRIEDLLYKKAAELAFEEGFASAEESEELLAKISSHA